MICKINSINNEVRIVIQHIVLHNYSYDCSREIFISNDGIISLGRSSCTCQTVLLFLFLAALQHLCFKLKPPTLPVVRHAVTFIDSVPQLNSFIPAGLFGVPHLYTGFCLVLLQLLVELFPRWVMGNSVMFGPHSECFVRQTG